MSLRANVSERGNLIKIIWQILCCPIVLMGLLRRFAPHNDKWRYLQPSLTTFTPAPHNDMWRYVQPSLTAFTLS